MAFHIDLFSLDYGIRINCKISRVLFLCSATFQKQGGEDNGNREHDSGQQNKSKAVSEWRSLPRTKCKWKSKLPCGIWDSVDSAIISDAEDCGFKSHTKAQRTTFQAGYPFNESILPNKALSWALPPPPPIVGKKSICDDLVRQLLILILQLKSQVQINLVTMMVQKWTSILYCNTNYSSKDSSLTAHDLTIYSI